jgi:UDP-glucose 4-epimerase
MSEKWLVTGSLGYIGSELYSVLKDFGHQVIGLDNLSTGVAWRGKNQDLVIEDLNNLDFLTDFLQKENFTGIAHLAAKKSVAESMINPDSYWIENTQLSNKLFEIASVNQVKKFLFASSAAVYRSSESDNPDLFFETSDLGPLSVYGQTKMATEKYIVEKSDSVSISSKIFRFFNVAGSTESTGWDLNSENFIPIAFRNLQEKETLNIFGNDYATPDGTCIRDYIHVHDIAMAIGKSTVNETNWDKKVETYNIGTGKGTSVFELVDLIESITGENLDIAIGARRAGDPAYAVASADKIKKELIWEPEFNIEEILKDSWKSFKSSID